MKQLQINGKITNAATRAMVKSSSAGRISYCAGRILRRSGSAQSTPDGTACMRIITVQTGAEEAGNSNRPSRRPGRYPIKELTFKVSPTGFKHTGLFPEQAVNWDWMQSKIRKAKAAGRRSGS